MSHKTLRKPQVNHMTQIYKTTKASDCLKKQEYSCFRSLTTCLTKSIRPVLAAKLLMRPPSLGVSCSPPGQTAAHQPARQADVRLFFFCKCTFWWPDPLPGICQILKWKSGMCSVQLVILPNCKALWCLPGWGNQENYVLWAFVKNPCFLHLASGILFDPKTVKS